MVDETKEKLSAIYFAAFTTQAGKKVLADLLASYDRDAPLAHLSESELRVAVAKRDLVREIVSLVDEHRKQFGSE